MKIFTLNSMDKPNCIRLALILASIFCVVVEACGGWVELDQPVKIDSDIQDGSIEYGDRNAILSAGDENVGSNCTAFAISHYVAITAGHCLDRAFAEREEYASERFDLSTVILYFPNKTFWGPKIVPVIDYEFHDLYPKIDAAVIYMDPDEEFRSEPFEQPLRIAEVPPRDYSILFVNGITAGEGTKDEGLAIYYTIVKVIQQTNKTILEIWEMLEALVSLNVSDPGDSGGPLYADPKPYYEGTLTLYGILSGYSSDFSIFAPVHNQVRSWLESRGDYEPPDCPQVSCQPELRCCVKTGKCMNSADLRYFCNRSSK